MKFRAILFFFLNACAAQDCESNKLTACGSACGSDGCGRATGNMASYSVAGGCVCKNNDGGL